MNEFPSYTAGAVSIQTLSTLRRVDGVRMKLFESFRTIPEKPRDKQVFNILARFNTISTAEARALMMPSLSAAISSLRDVGYEIVTLREGKVSTYALKTQKPSKELMSQRAELIATRTALSKAHPELFKKRERGFSLEDFQDGLKRGEFDAKLEGFPKSTRDRLWRIYQARQAA